MGLPPVLEALGSAAGCREVVWCLYQHSSLRCTMEMFPLDSCKICLAISVEVDKKSEWEEERSMSGMKAPVETHRVASRFHYNVGKNSTNGPYWARVTWSHHAVGMNHAVGTLLSVSRRAEEQPPGLTLGYVTGHTFSTYGSQGSRGYGGRHEKRWGQHLGTHSQAAHHQNPLMNRLISYSWVLGRRSCRAAMVSCWQEQQELQLGGKRWQLIRGWKTP